MARRTQLIEFSAPPKIAAECVQLARQQGINKSAFFLRLLVASIAYSKVH